MKAPYNDNEPLAFSIYLPFMAYMRPESRAHKLRRMTKRYGPQWQTATFR